MIITFSLSSCSQSSATLRSTSFPQSTWSDVPCPMALPYRRLQGHCNRNEDEPSSQPLDPCGAFLQTTFGCNGFFSSLFWVHKFGLGVDVCCRSWADYFEDNKSIVTLDETNL